MYLIKFVSLQNRIDVMSYIVQGGMVIIPLFCSLPSFFPSHWIRAKRLTPKNERQQFYKVIDRRKTAATDFIIKTCRYNGVDRKWKIN